MSIINESTAFIHVESGAYPLTLNSLRARHTNISFVAGDDVEFYRENGYEVVAPVDRPAGDVVSEASPLRKSDGSYVQLWDVRNYSDDEKQSFLNTKKEAFVAECIRLRTSALEVGVPIDFGGADGVQHIQMRDNDRANVLGLKARAEMLIASDQADSLIPVRTYENRTVFLLPQHCVDMAWIVFDGYSETMQKSWEVIDLAKAASTEAEIPAKPENFAPEQRILPA